jgi:hypothetical protein
MNVKQLEKWEMAGETSTWTKATYPNATIFITNPVRPDLGSNLSPREGKVATKRPSYYGLLLLLSTDLWHSLPNSYFICHFHCAYFICRMFRGFVSLPPSGVVFMLEFLLGLHIYCDAIGNVCDRTWDLLNNQAYSQTSILLCSTKRLSSNTRT